MNDTHQPEQNHQMDIDPFDTQNHPLIHKEPAQHNLPIAPSRNHAMSVDPPTGGLYGSIVQSLGMCFGAFGMVMPCICCCFSPMRQIEQGNVGLVTRFGKFYKIADPGLTTVYPFSEKIRFLNTQITVMELPSQSCMTKDNVKVLLSSVVYYYVTDPYKALYDVQNYERALLERTLTTLRLVAGSRSLQEIIERREEIAKAIQEIIDEVAGIWGIQVESILIKDIGLPEELQSSFAQAAMSKRIGESKIITARAEVESAKLMRKAADILESKAAMQIRYLDAMQNMAKSSNSKVIFMPSASAIESLADNLKTKSNGQNALPSSGLSPYEQQQAEDVIREAAQQERALPQTIVTTEGYY